jgi:hypothetical protein
MSYTRALLVATATLVALLALMPIVLLCLPFWIVGVLTHLFRNWLERKTITWEEIIEFDSLIGWRPKANLNAYCSFAAGVFRAETDSRGWAGKSSIADSDVVVFGDSYAFGYGVDAKSLFSELNPKLRIKSIGAPGYNMVQEYLLMRQLSPHLRDKLVVWFVYFGNDLYDNLLPNLYQYRMPFVRRRNGSSSWEIVTSHISRQKWPFNPEHNHRRKEKLDGTFGDAYLSRRIYSACEFLIGEGKDLCARSGASLVLMTIPWTIQLNPREWKGASSKGPGNKLLDPQLPDRKISEICSILHVPLIDGRKYLDLSHYIPGEGHWNEGGHRRVGEILAQLHHKFEGERPKTKEVELDIDPYRKRSRHLSANPQRAS